MKLKEKRIKLGNKIIKIKAKLQIILILFVLIICTGVGFIINFNNKSSRNNFPSSETKDLSISDETPTTTYEFNSSASPKESLNPTPATSTPSPAPKIYVHVSGAVQNPGLISLNSNSRVNDAINAAGGATKKANLDIINLAEPIYDGTKIHVPAIGETPAVLHSIAQPVSPTPSNEQGSNNTNPQKININTASINELITLNGIGETTAQNIIDYRKKNGAFKSIDDILNVSGIGDAKFSKIKNSICI